MTEEKKKEIKGKLVNEKAPEKVSDKAQSSLQTEADQDHLAEAAQQVLDDAAFLRALQEKQDMEKEAKDFNNAKPVNTELVKGEGAPPTKDSPAFVAAIHGVPENCMILLGGKPYVTSEGLGILADRRGVRAIQTKIQQVNDKDGKLYGYECTAFLWPKISKAEVEVMKLAGVLDKDVQKELLKSLMLPFEAMATATRDNTKDKMRPYMLELAETRAINRVKRQYVGFGLTSVEEMPEYENPVETGDY